MFIEQIIEFELWGPWPCNRTYCIILKLVIFRTKQRSPRKINRQVKYYLLLNILQKAMYLASLHLDQVNNAPKNS